MKNRRGRKYFSYFLIMLLFLAFVQLVPLDMVSSRMLHCPLEESWDELHICEIASGISDHPVSESKLFQKVDMPCRLETDMPMGRRQAGTTDDRLVQPANEQALDCRQPENAGEVVLKRSRVNRLEAGTFVHGKYQIYRILILVMTMLLFPYMLLQKLFRLSGVFKVTLWRNILYIHSTDGKKERRFSGIVVC